MSSISAHVPGDAYGDTNKYMTYRGVRGLTLAPSPSPLTSVRAARRDGTERREARVEGRALVADLGG